MVSQRKEVSASVQGLYASSKGDLDFAGLIAQYAPGNEDQSLAELIEVDGRARIAIGKSVELGRYLRAVPDLRSRQVPLDAAIDLALRSLSRSSRPTPGAVRALTEVHPDLEGAIRDAAALAEAMWSTTGLRRRLEPGPRRELPSDFGPIMPSGTRRFELRRLLGTGGWGEVYLALDRQLSEPGHEALVAIKFLTGGDRTPWARQRLIEEASKARRIDDAGVVRVLDRGVSDEDEDYIVYEYVDGGDLGQWLEVHPRLATREAARLMATIARGVHAAHAAGLVHCDLKPGNVLMTVDGRPKVADFGIAVRSGDESDSERLSADGRPIGNIAFISPEQFRGEDGSLTVASDIYALGGMLYFLLTRVLPNGDSAEAIARNHHPIDGRQAPPDLLGAGLRADGDLERICARAMSRDPKARYDSAAALADDLEAWLSHRPIYWSRPSAVRRALLWKRRNPAVAGAVMVSICTVVIGTIITARLSSVAADQRAAAARARESLSSARDGISNLSETAARIGQSGAKADLLNMVVYLEWLGGSKMLGPQDLDYLSWENRAVLVNERLDEFKRAGAENSLDSVMWSSILGVWMLRAGEWKAAEPLLAASESKLRAAWGPDEPWTLHIGMMRAAAATDRLLAKLETEPLTKADMTELEASERLISRVVSMPSPIDPKGIICRLGLKALAELYGPKLLNLPDKLAAVPPESSYSPEPPRPAEKVESPKPRS